VSGAPSRKDGCRPRWMGDGGVVCRQHNRGARREPSYEEGGRPHTQRKDGGGDGGVDGGRTASGVTLGAAHRGHLSPPLTSCDRTAPSFTH